MITTDAWVLYQGDAGHSHTPNIAALRSERFSFPDITEHEVLAEPIYGCWEGNMSHAIERQPVDICRQRGEEKVVIGNAGVVRVLKTGSLVTKAREGDMCLVFCNGIQNEFGHTKKVFAYDAPNTVGLLAKRMKMSENSLIPLPENTRYTPQQWAAFSLRYITAWANWKAAYGCYRVLMPEDEFPAPFVWGWGGGVTLAELKLAELYNCRPAMISSDARRLETIKRMGIKPIDRQPFIGLNFDERRYESDATFKESYQEAENVFLSIVKEETQGLGVSIFIDYIGLPVARATLKALGCPGVITTAGWKSGMKLSTMRAIECMNWHTHVHTHYARYAEGVEAVRFGESHGWMPPLADEVYGWDDIPRLVQEYQRGAISDYFPIYQVNSM
ncbi:MAG: hypothetical protein QOH49_4953 [Acidobacteriota bacterium]|jgi:NADPH:quinone reductase-like Zn-dependent oxidoreductase|nr:hypothetical protein [Acidobacteriota bacterium]